MYKFQGKIKVINDIQEISEKFKKREFVVTDTSSMYPQDVMFQSVQDKCAMLDGYSVEDEVEVSFNLRGREWTSPDGIVKYFNTLDAWRIEKMGQGAGIPQGGPSAMSLNAETTSTGSAENTNEKEEDDLPF